MDLPIKETAFALIDSRRRADMIRTKEQLKSKGSAKCVKHADAVYVTNAAGL